jgi:hypothetical protein
MKAMMARYGVEIYCAHNGVSMVLPWRHEAEFKDGVAFLRGLVGEPVGQTKRYPDQPDFYYLETENQFVALMEFRSAQGVKRPD